MRDLASDPAEDAATTKMVRRLGLRVRLASPSPQPLGRRSFTDVWQRQLRWARLRRATFLAEFLPEILSGSALPIAIAGFAAARLDVSVPGVMAGYAALWWSAEMTMAAACGWPLSWQTPLALCLSRLFDAGHLDGRLYQPLLYMEGKRRDDGSLEPGLSHRSRAHSVER